MSTEHIGLVLTGQFAAVNYKLRVVTLFLQLSRNPAR